MDSKSHPACYYGKENRSTDLLAVVMEDVDVSEFRLVDQSQAESSKAKTDSLNNSSLEISKTASEGDVAQKSFQSKDESLSSSEDSQQLGKLQKSQTSSGQIPLPLSPRTAAEGQNVSEGSAGLVVGAAGLSPTQTRHERSNDLGGPGGVSQAVNQLAESQEGAEMSSSDEADAMLDAAGQASLTAQGSSSQWNEDQTADSVAEVSRVEGDDVRSVAVNGSEAGCTTHVSTAAETRPSIEKSPQVECCPSAAVLSDPLAEGEATTDGGLSVSSSPFGRGASVASPFDDPKGGEPSSVKQFASSPLSTQGAPSCDPSKTVIEPHPAEETCGEGAPLTLADADSKPTVPSPEKASGEGTLSVPLDADSQRVIRSAMPSPSLPPLAASQAEGSDLAVAESSLPGVDWMPSVATESVGSSSPFPSPKTSAASPPDSGSSKVDSGPIAGVAVEEPKKTLLGSPSQCGGSQAGKGNHLDWCVDENEGTKKRCSRSGQADSEVTERPSKVRAVDMSSSAMTIVDAECRSLLGSSEAMSSDTGGGTVGVPERDTPDGSHEGSEVGRSDERAGKSVSSDSASPASAHPPTLAPPDDCMDGGDGKISITSIGSTSKPKPSEGTCLCPGGEDATGNLAASSLSISPVKGPTSSQCAASPTSFDKAASSTDSGVSPPSRDVPLRSGEKLPCTTSSDVSTREGCSGEAEECIKRIAANLQKVTGLELGSTIKVRWVIYEKSSDGGEEVSKTIWWPASIQPPKNVRHSSAAPEHRPDAQVYLLHYISFGDYDAEKTRVIFKREGEVLHLDYNAALPYRAVQSAGNETDTALEGNFDVELENSDDEDSQGDHPAVISVREILDEQAKIDEDEGDCETPSAEAAMMRAFQSLPYMMQMSLAGSFRTFADAFGTWLRQKLALEGSSYVITSADIQQFVHGLGKETEEASGKSK